jgi:uncharacterized membrane protein YqaE (UPF0057 family)
MKRKNKILFIVYTLIACNMLFSCSAKKVGFFNNSSSPYYVKDSRHNIKEIAVPGKEMPLLVSAEDMILEPKASPVIKSSRSEIGVHNEVNANVSPETVKKISREEKKEIRAILKKDEAGRTNVIGKLLLIIFAIILPPLAVALVDGLSGPFWLDLLLTILFYVPGMIYALYRVLRK